MSRPGQFLGRLRSGVSLVELVVVLALFCLLSSLVVSSFSFFNRSYPRVEIEKLYALCHYAQQKALMSNMQQEIVLDNSSSARLGYSFGRLHESCSGSVVFGFPEGAKGPPANPTRIVDSPVTFNNARIVFYPDGVISAGTVYIADKDRTVFYALTSGVGAVSFLRTYRYDNGWQLVS